jgi:hypothetical protein
VAAPGLNPLQLVLVGTVLEATAFLAEIPTGVLADVYSRRWSVIVGGPLVGLVATLVSIRAALVTAGLILSPALVLYVRSIRQAGARVPSSGRWLHRVIRSNKLGGNHAPGVPSAVTPVTGRHPSMVAATRLSRIVGDPPATIFVDLDSSGADALRGDILLPSR